MTLFTYNKQTQRLEEKATMPKPVISDYPLTNQGNVAHYEDTEKYLAHIASLRSIPCAPGTEWPEGDLTEKQDFQLGCIDCECRFKRQCHGRMQAYPIQAAKEKEKKDRLRWSDDKFSLNQTEYYTQRLKWVTDCIKNGLAIKEDAELLENLWDKFRHPDYVEQPADPLDERKYSVAEIKEEYKAWCKATKRNGAVLVGGSIQEFFNSIDKITHP